MSHFPALSATELLTNQRPSSGAVRTNRSEARENSSEPRHPTAAGTSRRWPRPPARATMSNHPGVLGAPLHRPLPIPTRSKSKRLRTKRERNAAKFGPKLPLGGSRQGPTGPPRWLQPPLWGGLALGSPLGPPKPVVITQKRLCHRGLFNHEVKSLDVRRLLTPGPGRDGPPPAPQIEEGEVGGVKDLVASLASLLGSFRVFGGRELVSERRQSLLAVLRRHRRGPPDLGVFLAHRTPAQPPGTAPTPGGGSGAPEGGTSPPQIKCCLQQVWGPPGPPGKKEDRDLQDEQSVLGGGRWGTPLPGLPAHFVLSIHHPSVLPAPFLEPSKGRRILSHGAQPRMRRMRSPGGLPRPGVVPGGSCRQPPPFGGPQSPPRRRKWQGGMKAGPPLPSGPSAQTLHPGDPPNPEIPVAPPAPPDPLGPPKSGELRSPGTPRIPPGPPGTP
ncbi:proline-rich protein 19 [Poecile atricapillus]|uniref:proline-rich protein 19 n=1 Tax=Poecile atricapillus TaxID=48891 RepID=UPI00273A17AF|nr:proline-rich protein 19 [Poecile atricapillus]